ncbi:STM4014 family protein [Verrucomicrobium sp. BvORR034]|uniref:STM4014 family protein n=1 Tax=Verrucomicrobium sp. BvORR034 TaxID=1396418 RepID=UPI002240FA47|nr:STM4014 family protein [Verrucomicrobium sp. BvORR034]
MREHLFVIGIPGTKRLMYLDAAVSREPRVCVHHWSWLDVIRGGVNWAELRQHSRCWLRLESPGKDWAVEQALLQRGAEGSLEPCFESWTTDEVGSMTAQPGLIVAQAQWWLGWRKVLQEIRDALATRAPHVICSSPPEEVAILFHKHACQERLEAAGVACPAASSVITGGYEEIREMMERPAGAWRRLFLKPCHGSSASGVVALEVSPHRGIQARTTVEMQDAPSGGVKLFNRRQLQRYTDPAEVKRLCDHVTRHRAYVQQWVPKAGWQGLRMDLRVVVIAGGARHVVPRLSEAPMTNLQLGGRRGDAAQLREHMGEEAWQRLLATAEGAAAAFPASLHVSLDIAPTSGFRRFLVLEANAFGDFLPDLLWEGRETYDWELEAMLTQVSTSGA